MTIILEHGADTENSRMSDDKTIILCEQRIYSPSYVDTGIVKYEDNYYLLVMWIEENGSNCHHQIIIQGELSILNGIYSSMSGGHLDLFNTICYKWKHSATISINLKLDDLVKLLNTDSDTTE